MNKAEVADMLGLICVRYPNAKRSDNPELEVLTSHMVLADVPNAAVQAALIKWFKTQRFAPDPAEIREIVLFETGIVPSDDEAWRMVRSYASSWQSGLGWKTPDGEPPETLPPPVHAAFRAVGGASSINSDVTRAQFSKAYATCRANYSAEINIGAALAALPEPKNVRRIG